MKKWTVIYLIKCDEEPTQLAALDAMLDDILSLKITSETAVLFCMQLSIRMVQRLDPQFVTLKSSDPTDITTVFYQAEALHTPKNNKKSRLVPWAPEESDFVITSIESIRHYFADLVLAGGFEAEHYLLFTWGHGGAAGIYFDGTWPEYTTDSRASLLTMEALGTAIKESFGPMGIDVVIMMNCFMQYFDALYALWDAHVSYLVASQYGMDFVGYNYKEIFSAIYATPNLQPLHLAKLATASLKTLVNAEQLGDAAIFSSDLTIIPLLGKAIGDLGQTLKITTPLVKNKIKQAVEKDKYSHSGYDLIDVFFFSEIIRGALGPDWEAATRSILDLRDQLIIAGYQGKESSRPGINQGCNIFMPRVADRHFFYNFINKDARHASLFQRSAAGKWQDFIVDYLNILAAGPTIIEIMPPGT
jgi:cysteine peptidase C11 family protein